VSTVSPSLARRLGTPLSPMRPSRIIFVKVLLCWRPARLVLSTAPFVVRDHLVRPPSYCGMPWRRLYGDYIEQRGSHVARFCNGCTVDRSLFGYVFLTDRPECSARFVAMAKDRCLVIL
jgi:hypothetical protein